jgi:hypothetical protein
VLFGVQIEHELCQSTVQMRDLTAVNAGNDAGGTDARAEN